MKKELGDIRVGWVLAPVLFTSSDSIPGVMFCFIVISDIVLLDLDLRTLTREVI